MKTGYYDDVEKEREKITNNSTNDTFRILLHVDSIQHMILDVKRLILAQRWTKKKAAKVNNS